MDNYCGVGCRVANHPDGKLYVAEVHAWGGAAQSGSVFVGDVLNTVNGLPVFSSDDAESVTMCRPDTSVTLGISRAGADHNVTVVCMPCPQSAASAQPVFAAAINHDIAPEEEEEEEEELDDCVPQQRWLSLFFGDGGILLSPVEFHTEIKRALELIRAELRFFAQRCPSGFKRHRQEALPLLSSTLAEFSPLVPVRVMFRCVGTACQRLTTAPGGMHVIYKTTWCWAACVMDRVARGRVSIVQFTLADFWAAATTRLRGKPDIFDATKNGDLALVWDHLAVDASCIGRGHPSHHNIGETPLHWSTRYGQLEICRLLLQSNAYLEAKDKSGETPLHWSARFGQLEICRLLLQSNADLEAKDKSAFGCDYDSLKFLGRTPLHFSAYGQLEICRLLLQSSADVGAKTLSGQTALHISAAYGQLEICRLLLQSNADLHAKDNGQATPLHWSVCRRYSCPETCRWLLQSNADIDAKTYGHFTPLHLCASYGNSEICRLLLQSNADIDAKTKEHWTPLHWSVSLYLGGSLGCHSGDIDGKRVVCRLLVEGKADVAARSSDGFTALKMASSKNLGDTFMADYLSRIGAPL